MTSMVDRSTLVLEFPEKQTGLNFTVMESHTSRTSTKTVLVVNFSHYERAGWVVVRDDS